MAESAAGFWSYVRDDDEGDGNRITQLANDLRAVYGLKTGSGLELFVDRDSIAWGDAWEERINQAIAGTTFFIPIITPRYFQSQPCRRELLKFIGEARRLGLEKLLLPVYYVSVPELEREPGDEVMVLVAERQWEDLREIRLVDQESSAYRAVVDRLAGRVAEIAAEVTRRPREGGHRRPSAEEPDQSEREGEEQEHPGVVELLAEGEEALPRLVETMEALGDEIDNLGELSQQAEAEIHASDARGAGFAGRLAVAERFARRLKEPAEKIRELGRSYAADLVRIDPAMLAMLDELERDPTQVSEAAEFLKGIHGLQSEAGPATDSLEELTHTLAEGARLSRSLRAPLGEIRAGLQGVLDGRTVIEEWDRRARSLERYGARSEPDEAGLGQEDGGEEGQGDEKDDGER